MCMPAAGLRARRGRSCGCPSWGSEGAPSRELLKDGALRGADGRRGEVVPTTMASRAAVCARPRRSRERAGACGLGAAGAVARPVAVAATRDTGARQPPSPGRAGVDGRGVAAAPIVRGRRSAAADSRRIFAFRGRIARARPRIRARPRGRQRRDTRKRRWLARWPTVYRRSHQKYITRIRGQRTN